MLCSCKASITIYLQGIPSLNHSFAEHTSKSTFNGIHNPF